VDRKKNAFYLAGMQVSFGNNGTSGASTVVVTKNGATVFTAPTIAFVNGLAQSGDIDCRDAQGRGIAFAVGDVVGIAYTVAAGGTPADMDVFLLGESFGVHVK